MQSLGHDADMLLFIKHNHCHHRRVLGFLRSLLCYTLVLVLVLGIGIARGQYYWILDIGCLSWYRSNPSHVTNKQAASCQKCRPINLVSRNIRFMGIFVGVPLGGGVKWEWGSRRRKLATSRRNGIWETTRHNGLLSAPTCYGLDADLLRGNWCSGIWLLPFLVKGYLDPVSSFK